MLEEATRNCLIIPILFQGQIKISHLFFANDIFLFTQPTRSCCFHLKDILDKFCSCSGQLISTPKSKLFFSSNLRCQDKDRI